MVAAMRSDSSLNAIIARRVYSGDPPQNAEYPYIVFGETNIGDEGTKGSDNVETSIPLHYVDESLDTQSAYQALKALDTLFHDPASLALSGGAVVNIRRSVPRGVQASNGDRRVYAVATYVAFLCS